MMNRLIKWVYEPSHLFVTMTAFAGLLCLSLLGNIILYNKTQDLEHQNKIAREAAIEACITGKPRATKLISGLGEYFSEQTVVAFNILSQTDESSPLFEPRRQTYLNDMKLQETLRDLLPIECQRTQNT